MFDARAGFAALTTEASDDAARLAAIRDLEELKCAATARQAELAAQLDTRPADGRERTDGEVAADLARARRESPHRGRQHLALARILPTELPHTWAAFAAGRITEWKATLIARETGCLTLEHRQQVDQTLAADPGRLEAMGDRELEHTARRLAYQLDPAADVARRARAEADRTVTLRPAPDTMTYLTALVPAEQGVAAYAALVRAADSARAAGETRGKGQVMADTLVERLTGQATAADVPVRVNLVISDQALLGGHEPAHLHGYGPLPAGLARQWLTGAARKTLRRLYAAPATGQLVAMESRSRAFSPGLATLIGLRDQTCRTPWCDAPIRHTDHVLPVAKGGRTSLDNGQGLCEACNLAKGDDGDWHRSGAPPGPRPDLLHSPAEAKLSADLAA
jgi:hypothetical protein